MSEKLFRIIEPGKSKRSIVGYIKKEDIYDYIAEHKMFHAKEYKDTYENCLEYKFKLANMFRALAEEIECCEIEEASKSFIDDYKIIEDNNPQDNRGLLYGIKIRKVNADEHKEANERNKEEM